LEKNELMHLSKKYSFFSFSSAILKCKWATKRENDRRKNRIFRVELKQFVIIIKINGKCDVEKLGTGKKW